jgi:hypothetical protein
MLTQEEINKLPKWAQSKINTLQMRLNEVTKERNRLLDNPESNTIIGNGYRINDEEAPIQYAKNNQQITFRLPNCNIRIRIDKDYLDVNMSENKYATRLCVLPNAANSLYLTVKDF